MATSWTSLVDTRGHLRKDFALADVFGVSLEHPNWVAWPHYISPTPVAAADFGDFSAEYPAFARTTGQQVRAGSSVQVLATTTLVWPAPDGSKFASIHSNPPWVSTQRPEIVLNRFGQGTSIYCSSPIEMIDPLSDLQIKLLRRLSRKFSFEAEAPAAVELTLFHQPEQHRYRLCLVNFQKDLPNIPVENILIRLSLPGKVHRIVQLPGGQAVAHTPDETSVAFTVPRLETLAMFAVIVG
jgi:hypothetical protein